MAKKTVPFRLYIQILIFSALVALGAMILLPLQQAMREGMIGIRDKLIANMELRIDRKIRYSSISPSIFGSFDVRNVRIIGEDELPVLTMSRFRVAYSLLDMLRGKALAIHSVRIDSPLIDFNTNRDADLISLFTNFSASEDGSLQDLSEMFPEKMILRIRNGKCLVLNDGGQFEFDTLNLDMEIAQNRVIFDGGWTVGVMIDALVGEPARVSVAMKTNGSCRTNLKEGEAVFRIPSVTGDIFSTSPIAFGFVLENGFIRVGKMKDQFPFDLSLRYGIHDGTIDARFFCKDFRLREYILLLGGLERASQILDIAGTGTASFERRRDGGIGYSIDLSGTALVEDSQLFHAESASFRINSSGNEERAYISTLRFSLPRTGKTDILFSGDIGFSGSVGLGKLAPDGVISLVNFSLSGEESVNADIAVITDDGTGKITVFCETLSMGKIGLAALNAALTPSEHGMAFTVSALHYRYPEYGPGPAGSQADGSLSLGGSVNSVSRRLDAELCLDSFSAGDIAGMALPFIANSSLLVSSRGLLNGAAINAKINFTLFGAERRFALHEGLFTRGEDTLSLSGRAGYSNSKDINFLVNAGYRNLGYLIEGEILDGKSVSVQGSYGLELKLVKSGAKIYAGSMSAEDFPVPFLGQPAFLSCTAQLRYASADSWSVNLERFELAGINCPAGLAQIRVSGSADQRGANFPLLYYHDAAGPLSGKADIFWTADYSGFSAVADMGGGAEKYHIEGSFSDGYGDFAFSGASMRLDRAFGRRINARADGDIRLSWNSPESFRAEFDLMSVNGKIYDQEFKSSARAVLSGGELLVNRLDFKFAGLEGIVSHLVISGSRGIAMLRAEVAGLAGGKPLRGGLSFSADFRPMESWFEIDKMLNSVTGAAHIEDFSYGGGDAQSFTIALSRSGGAVSVSGGPRNMIRFRMDPDGNFFAGLSTPSPVRGTVIGSVRHKTINARCGDLYIDAGELFKLLPENGDIYLTGGYVTASVDIRGPVSDPEFFGSARGTSLRIRIPSYITRELRPIPFTVAIDGNEIRFGPVAASVGSGSGTVTGLFLIDRWIPNIFSIDITVPRETPIPYGFDIAGFTARGDASGRLNVSMENMAFDISGELYANNAELGVNTDEINRPRDDFFQARFPYVVDLVVSTGPVVEFYYPLSRFPILRATPEMGTKIHVTADALTQQYSVTSDVKIRSGEMYYFERSFFIRSGTLIFRENEIRFDPRLAVRAELRDRTEDGPVTISMIVDNAPLRSFVPRFESAPALSQMEIFSLMGQNITGTQPYESANSIIRAGSDLLTQFVMGRELERQIRNFTRLDMFSVRTQVLQNALFMATGLLPPPVDTIGGVGNYFNNTTVYGGKYIGQDMFVQGMLSVRYDANNPSFGGLTFAPDIGIELQNPLFSIRWDFVPTHPENWYVSDNSITLTWSRTF
ncbi:MAG: translocation/assembly module TamB domain-containing protein [Treponema sp.]|jgi:hypothetical protein|nr:translocation/assembly module TamB domain-containing protein [Treponema sp.]